MSKEKSNPVPGPAAPNYKAGKHVVCYIDGQTHSAFKSKCAMLGIPMNDIMSGMIATFNKNTQKKDNTHE